MSEFHDLLVKRRSIRRFTSEPLSAEDVKQLLEAALLAPSSKNQRSVRLVAVDQPDTLTRLADCKPMASHAIADAAMAVVVGGDMTLSDPWIEDCSIAATLMQLQAEELGLGSVWIQVRGRQTADGIPSEDHVRSLLNIPENIGIVCILAIGHKAEERKPQNTEKLMWEHVHIERWNPANTDE